MLNLQGKLSDIKSKREKVEQMIADAHYETIEQQIMPGQKAYDFMEFAKGQSQASHQKLLEQELNQLLKNRKEFDPKSKEASVFEQELKVLSCHALLNEALGKSNNESLEQFSYVLAQLGENRVKLTPTIAARMFEYTVLGEKHQIANDLLLKLTKDRTEQLSIVDPRYLQKFFEQSLKRDNLDGVAHLVNYSERYGVDLSGFPVNNFRSAIDYYLNKKFDLSKVMTFLKFYQRHMQDKARREFDQVEPISKEISDEAIHSLSNKIFGQSDGLIDLPALFDHLVSQVGSRQVLDPLTKEDSLWKLVESQTMDKDYIRAASMSLHSRLSGQSVAKYLGNQLSRSTSFDRTFKTALRLQGTPMAEAFFSEMMRELNSYSLKNQNKLPISFTDQKLSDLYLRLKQSGVELSPAMSELLLYSLSVKGMHKEIINFCTEKGAPQSEIEKYYLSESLLQGTLKDKAYSEALRTCGVYDGEEMSACQLAQKTKAMFLEGSNQAAVDFFRQELNKREGKAKEHKDLMVALYDNVIDSKSGSKLTYEEFLSKHERSALFQKRLSQQAFAVGTLQKIIANNDYDGIQDAFSLYMVMRQERELLGSTYGLDGADQATQMANLKKLGPDEMAQLKQIQARKADLQQKLHIEDYQRLKELVEVARDGTLNEVSGLDQHGLNRMLDIYKGLTFDEARQSASALLEDTTADRAMQGLSSESEQVDTIVAEKAKDTFDWFALFANQKEAYRNQTIRETVFEHTQAYQNRTDKAEPAQVNKGKLLWHKSHRQVGENIMKSQFGESYAEGLFNSSVDASQKDVFGYDPENDAITDLEKKNEYLENVLQAYDPVKENELELKWQLHAKKAVIMDELSKDRYGAVEKLGKGTKSEMLDYATSVALLQLEAKDLEKQLGSVDRQLTTDPHAMAKTAEYRDLYNLNQVKEDDELAQSVRDEEMLRDGADGRTVLDYFKKRADAIQSVDQYFNLVEAEMDYESAILSERHSDLEKEARQIALKQYLNKGNRVKVEVKEEDEPAVEEEVESKGFLGNKKPAKKTVSKTKKEPAKNAWEVSLREVEENQMGASYQYFFYGRKEPVQDESPHSLYTHPRQILEDLCQESLSENDAATLVWERLGINEFEESDADDSDAEEVMNERATELADEKIINHYHEGLKNHHKNQITDYIRKDMMEVVNSMRKQQRDNRFDQDETRAILNKYNHNMLYGKFDYRNMLDPMSHAGKAHDKSLMELREELTKAVTERKAAALPVAIKIFNKLQEKTVKSTKYDDFVSRGSDGSVSLTSLNDSIDKVDVLLNDQSSPLLSNLRAASKYATQKLPQTIEEYRATVKDGNIVREPVDLNMIINDYRTICKTEDKLQDIEAALSKAQEMLDTKESGIKEEASRRQYEEWLQESKVKSQQGKEAYMRRLYDQYLDAGETSPITDDQKVSLLRDVFQTGLGDGNHVNCESGKSDSSFPAFYAIDLIQFGLKRKIPAAIRLGEFVMAENCESHQQAVMPKELARAVKDFMFEHQESYQAAAKFTGPINATQIYHQARMANSKEGDQPVFFTMDDPYWVRFQQQNYRREDNWRLPSIMAWDHKPYGLVGEVLDFERLERLQTEREMKM